MSFQCIFMHTPKSSILIIGKIKYIFELFNNEKILPIPNLHILSKAIQIEILYPPQKGTNFLRDYLKPLLDAYPPKEVFLNYNLIIVSYRYEDY